MWGPHHEPPPIEKIRKAQWTPENTAKTQAVVNDLFALKQLVLHFAEESRLTRVMQRAIDRFVELDREVKLPS